ncbi:MAG TPA: hypothetical protein VGH13_02685 [Xanthobacteraceae bacterium]|jgi:hypothetical protein
MRKTGIGWLTSWPFGLSSAGVLIVLAGTAWLWARYGTAVFFETVRAGFVACFG